MQETSNGVEMQSTEGAAEETATTLRPAPFPSMKRRESQAGEIDSTVLEKDEKTGQKRKRRVSPPWQFPTVENTTMKSADGRRVSARVNTNTPGPSESSDGRARSISVSQSSRSRQPSPPWKKFGAEGPTSIQIDGKRKSGRVNKELGGQPKRTSPRTKKQVDRLGSERKSDTKPNSRGRRKDSQGPETLQRNGVKREDDEYSPTRKISHLREQINAIRPTRSFPAALDSNAHHKRKRSTDVSDQTGKTATPNNRRSTRHDVSKLLPKLSLHNPSARHTIAPPHPNAIPPPAIHPPQPSLYQVIERYELREMQQPHMENERGPPDAEWFAQRNERQAMEEAAIRKRILEAAKPNGPLSKQNLSIFHDEPQREPPPQYGHNDHLVSQAIYFRHLLLREKTAHRAQAKKLAYEAVDYWRLMRGPTEEDIQKEQNKIYRKIYEQIRLDIDAKWAMVSAHVQQLRKAKYEAEEEQKRQERLRQRLAWSEKMIAKQRGDDESVEELDEDSTGDMIDSDDDDDDDDNDDHEEEENMSESESETGTSDTDENDGEMGEEELAAYLAQRAAEPPDKPNSDSAEEEDDDLEQSDTELATGDVSELGPAHTPKALEEEEQSSNDIDESKANPEIEETKPDDDVSRAESEEPKPENASVRLSSRQAGEEPAETINEDFDAEDDTSDESVDMYDSDEDMSSTGDEDNDGDESSDEEEDVSDEEDSSRGLLGFYQPKQLAALGQLPTPTTSAEGDVRDVAAEAGSSAQAEGQAETAIQETAEPVTEDARVEVMPDVDVEAPPPAINDHEAIPDVEIEAPVPATNDQEERVAVPKDAEVEEIVREPESPGAAAGSDNESKERVPQPTLLRGNLRSYQHDGLRWLASLNDHGTNGILADEMGLGKTIQTISLLAHLAEQKDIWETHLVIVPTSVVLNWVTEFQRFLPGFRVLGYYGSLEERQLKRKHWVNDPHHHDRSKRGYNVIITSYNVAMQDINAIRNVQWHYLVLDEAHNIRNFNSQRWQVLIRLKTYGRLLLTGTPLQNSLTELWSLLTFLTAGDDDPAHGNLEEFLSHWKEPVKEIFDRGVSTLSTEAQKIVDQLHISLRPFLLRRLKTEVEKDLPKKTESVVVCKLSKRQRQLYQEYMGLASTRESLQRGNAVSAGKVLMSLRRVCNHPDLFDPRPIQTSYAMEQSAVEAFSLKEGVIRRLLGAADELPSGLIVASHEGHRKYSLKRSKQLAATDALEKELKKMEATAFETPDPSSVTGIRALQRLRKHENKMQRLRNCIEITKNSLRDTPVYGTDLRERVTLRSGKPYTFMQPGRPPVKTLRGWLPLCHRPIVYEHKSDWLLSKESVLQRDVLTLDKVSEQLNDIIIRFAFCTPVVTAPILKEIIPAPCQEIFRNSDAYPSVADFAHEARQRISIVFPDSRLLVYDSGKLQRLAVLLRDLQSRGSRSLIFTQMVKVLDILEQFLSLMGLPYLRLDGSTSVERRQIYTAEFNQPDSKYQVMILSSRAGGVGLNLTGASSVIFYDLDWNPQMDRQCMDRAHRIGQVRDVEVYKMVSEKTVEENILRRANQKSLLDQTVIQEGQFTTDYHQTARRGDDDEDGEEPDVTAAIERYLGGGEKANAQAMESVEDKEDVAAAQQARKEDHQDDADFAERSSKGPSAAATPGPTDLEGTNLYADEDVDGRGGHVDVFMIKHMEYELRNWIYTPPPVKRLDRHGRDRSHRKSGGRRR
ncbi:Hypothetical protein R9X50_00345800 [Acrodontium crateriforme]|uniref:DNA helicase n=1 Tax=Acrodontium crateriforme TaxID=150365 RepID=A0AAQ3RBV4_9PEZI|nr:Hypothetical protein R9X50_00345800 [Acrodontium crateriforme]